MKKFIEYIEKYKKIFLTTHINPDADGICSGLSLMNSLKDKYSNKEFQFIIDDTIPSNLNFIKNIDVVKEYNNINKEDLECDLLIVLDAPLLDRVGSCKDILSKEIINIDHHLGNEMFGNINIVDVNFSSTCEAVFHILNENNIEISKDSANKIYTGIISDTGNMSWGNITENTFETIYKLKKIGIDNKEIVEKIFLTRSKEQIGILKYLIGNLNVVEENKIIYTFLPFEKMKELKADSKDSEGIVDILKTYIDSELAILLKEQEDGMVRCSLRSNTLDVNRLASLFGGGGHRAASGFTTSKKVDEIIEKCIEFVREQ